MSRLLIITSSTRPGRTGAVVTPWVADLARRHGAFDVEIADLAEIGLPFLDEPDHPSEQNYRHQHTRDWSAVVDAADAFVIVTAEYNRGITAPLKNALDYLDSEWHAKPVGFVSYGMSSAGLRAVEMATQVVTALKMVPLCEVVPLPLRQVLDEQGRFTPLPHLAEGVRRLLDELERYAEVLRPLRVAALSSC